MVVWKIKTGLNRYIVQFWASLVHRGRRAPRWHFIFGPLYKSWCQRQHFLSIELAAVSIEIRRLKSHDFEALCRSQARDLEEAALEGNCSRLYQLLRKLRPFVPRRDIRFLDESGQPSDSDKCERQVVRNEFMARLKATTQCTFQSLIDEDRDTCALVAGSNADMQLGVGAIPTLQFLTKRNAHARLCGFGETPIGGEVYRLAPDAMASILLPLHVKSAVSLRLPL